MTRLLSGVICTACWFPLTSQPQVIFGVYGSPRSGQDAIRVTRKGNGKVGLTLKLYYANGHTCQLNKDGEWHSDHDSGRWIAGYISDLLNAHKLSNGIDFDTAESLLSQERQTFEQNLGSGDGW
jgi:hypothetical protein